MKHEYKKQVSVNGNLKVEKNVKTQDVLDILARTLFYKQCGLQYIFREGFEEDEPKYSISFITSEGNLVEHRYYKL